ncbi:MAG: hypothetical protein M1170_01670 [Patescibacteria group bacterium]|nr:hypothetical protein [Patescibacteria group bacterium]
MEFKIGKIEKQIDPLEEEIKDLFEKKLKENKPLNDMISNLQEIFNKGISEEYLHTTIEIFNNVFQNREYISKLVEDAHNKKEGLLYPYVEVRNFIGKAKEGKIIKTTICMSMDGKSIYATFSSG